MDSNINIDSRGRRSSLGRSSLIERSIKLLDNFLSNEFDEGEFSGYILNNELLGEFRSILWRVYLGILPTPYSKRGWITATKASRSNFEKLLTDPNFQGSLSFYNSKLNGGSQSNSNFNLGFNFEDEFELIKNELQDYSAGYDIFKSEFLKKSFLTIYLAWRVNNNTLNLNKNSITFVSRILAILIYSLYPCILHLNENFDEISDDEEDIKNLFYYLNLEDYFEHDIYAIFEKLLQFSDMQQYVINFSQGALEHKLDQDIKNISAEDQSLADLLEQKLNLSCGTQNNFMEDVSYIYLYVLDKDLLQMLHTKGIDVYNLTANYYLSMFYNATKFENITYYIDNVLMHCRTEELRFLGYLVISTLFNLQDELANLSKKEIEDILYNFHLTKRDPKDIVGKALKVRQKINKKFFNLTKTD